jgi:hypothetical protein
MPQMWRCTFCTPCVLSNTVSFPPSFQVTVEANNSIGVMLDWM